MKDIKKSGFTLVELLVVVAVLGVLLTIAIVAINPARQFAQANNRKRQSDIVAILNAITQYTIDQKGDAPNVITSQAGFISKDSIDLCAFIVPSYIAGLPTDPQLGGGQPVTDCASQYNTFYDISIDVTDRVTVTAPGSELNEVITATR
jgi:prepilin-type N-terminal cleavage/methylation domain-containing protein